MRLPTSKIWRAFPELDPFDDKRCQRYVAEAKRTYWKSGWGVAALVPVALVLWWLSMLGTISILELLIPGGAGPGRFGTFVAAMLFAGSPLALGIGLLYARDRWLHKAVRLRLNEALCVGCRYSLLGLDTLSDGRTVICPECGREGELTEDVLEQMRTLGVA